MSIIFVHGRDQQGSTQEQLINIWCTALDKGLAAAGESALPTHVRTGIRLPYYAQKLADFLGRTGGRPRTRDQGLRGGRGLFSDGNLREATLAFETDFVKEAIARTETIDRRSRKSKTSSNPNDVLRTSNVDQEDLERSLQNQAPVLVLARFLNRHAVTISRSLIDNTLRDVGLYLSDIKVRKVVDEIVAQAIISAPEPRVVVAHSLGTVVAFHIISSLRPDSCPIKHFITLGSPLGVNAVMSRLDSETLTWPNAVAEWTNFSDRRDIVALEPSLDRLSLFKDQGRTRDGKWDLKTAVVNISDLRNQTPNCHGIIGYLEDPLVASSIVTAMKKRGVLDESYVHRLQP